METSTDILLWRSSLARAPDVPDIGDQLRLADLCRGIGADAAVRMLYESAFLRQGFSPQARALQAGIMKRAGLWDEPLAAATNEQPSAGGTIAIALAELGAFARDVSRHRSVTRPQDAAATPAPPAPAVADFGDLAEFVHTLCTFLREPMTAGGRRDMDALLPRLCALALQGERFDYRTFATAPLPLLLSAISFAGIQEFILLNHDALFGQLGSATLLHSIARFDSGGLGPYFTSLPRLARKSGDIFALAAFAKAAGEEEGRPGLTLDRWVQLLSQHLTGGLRAELIDDLGDLGKVVALADIFDRAVRRPDHKIELSVIMRLRDAALDNGDYLLAARAQTLIVRLHPDELLEREILGSIEASGGLVAAAEQTFLDALKIVPGDAQFTTRLVALRTGDFARFAVRQGFGTPRDRLLVRRARSNGAPAASPVQGKRALSVDL